MISHDIFDELNYQYLWMRDYNISFFEKNKNILIENAELVLLNYYMSIVELR